MNTSKYKIIEYSGCTSFDFQINDVSLSDISPAEQDEILNYLFIKIKEGIKDNSINFKDVVDIFQYSDFGSDEHACKQCGDTVSWTKWEI